MAMTALAATRPCARPTRVQRGVNGTEPGAQGSALVRALRPVAWPWAWGGGKDELPSRLPPVAAASSAEWHRYRCRGRQGQPLGLLPQAVALHAGVCQLRPQQFGHGAQGGDLRFQDRGGVRGLQFSGFKLVTAGALCGGTYQATTGFTQRQFSHGSTPSTGEVVVPAPGTVTGHG